MSDATNVPATRESHSLKEVMFTKTPFGAALIPESLADVIRLGELMAKADIVMKKHLRGNPGACVALCMRALRWEMDPFAVADKTYEVNGVLAYEAQLVAAVVHTRAPIVGRPRYVYTGDGPSRQCQVVCVMTDGEDREYTTPRFDQITTKNSPLWKSDPDQQLGYFAIRSWARRHTPEVILGVYTPEEVETFRDVTPRPSGLRERLVGGTTEGFNPQTMEAEITGEPVATIVETVETILEEAVDPPPAEVVAEDADPLMIDMATATDDQVQAWAEGFKAVGLKQKSADQLIALWKIHFEDHIKPLHGSHAAVYDVLEAWMEARVKKLKSQASASA